MDSQCTDRMANPIAYWPEPTDPPIGLFDVSALPGVATRDEIVEQYAAESGRD